MNKVKQRLLFLFAFIFLLISSPTNSFACSCVEPGTVDEEMSRSSAVFSGKVIETVDQNKDNSIQSSADPIAVLFEVEESWKGISQSQILVYTERSSASCGYNFQLNKEYIVYAQERDGELWVSLCSRTALLASAETDKDQLGEGKKPLEQVTIDVHALQEGDETVFENLIRNNFFIMGLMAGIVVVSGFTVRHIKKSE